MGQMTRLLTVLCGVVLLCGGVGVLGGCQGGVSDKKIDFIDLNQAIKLYDEGLEDSEAVLFIDVRNKKRFDAGHVKGARNIRVNEIDLRYDADPELLKFDNLVVYGENPGSASARAMAKRMIEGGYNTILKARVRLYLGGWVVWESTGLPFEVDAVDDEDVASGEGDK